ncbi:MAG: asparagine synthase (glutamine-hydrolyzing) [Planctomycetes bacterium]|nr:asparagine synthase (glutamine-hydrolyzing) [Planctomycetota bacterium]
MCGIAGLLARDGATDYHNVARSMAEAITHRGPDESGVWGDADAGVFLSHRRLSILELSPAGSQPMTSPSGRYTMVFNGEIYNFSDLRKELEAAGSTEWRGHSDTEVMLFAFEKWGIEASLEKFTGMFAFAVWDNRERELYLVRDRIGEKPLYYSIHNSRLIFASELKSLHACSFWQPEIDRNSLSLYARHTYVPAPWTIFRDVFKLEPGTVLRARFDGNGMAHEIKPYWNAREAVERRLAEPFAGSDAEALDKLESMLRGIIGRQMVADVPVGAFLSGGIDSSLIVALMQSMHGMPVKTFTIGFTDDAYNEANHARNVADHLGTDHTEIYVSPEDSLSVVPRLADIYDEPFADSSQVPTFLVSQITRRNVTVSLSGDAGDELFCGYTRYMWLNNIWSFTRKFPRFMRPALSGALGIFSPWTWDRLFSFFGPVLPASAKQTHPGDKLHKLSEVLTAETPEEMYHRLISVWNRPSELVLGGTEPLTAVTDSARWAKVDSITERMMFIDLISYLPGDILVKVDRAAMANSLETRIPFLDHHLCEFAWSLPMSMKMRNGKSKWLLRKLLYKYVPEEIIERPKMGFASPIGEWLRGPLREWAGDLLAPERLRREGYFNAEVVARKWKEHLSGKRGWQAYLWTVLMFQQWRERWG